MEGGPANIYLRRLGAEIAWSPLLGPCSPLTPRVDAAGLRATGEWLGLHVTLRLVLAAGAPTWFWHVHDREPDARRGQRGPHLRAGPGTGALRRDPHERVLRQPVRRLHAAHPRGARLRPRRAPEPVDGRPSTVGRDRLAGPRCELRHGRAPTARSRNPRRRGPGGTRRAAPPRHTSSARTLDGRDPGRAADPRPGVTAHRGFFGWFEPDHQAATSDADSRRSIVPSPCRKPRHHGRVVARRLPRARPRPCSQRTDCCAAGI